VVGGATVDPATRVVSVRFELRDDRGYPVDLAGLYSLNAPITPRFSLAYLQRDPYGNLLPYKVLTKGSSGSPTAFTPDGGAGGTLVENGTYQGDYTYTFPPSAALDPGQLATTHTIWIQAARQTDPNDRHTIKAVNFEHDFIPSGVGSTVKREVVATANCNNCHNGFRIYALEDGFHGGARNNANYCGICHNPDRTSGRDNSNVPAAEAARFVHRIHNSENLRSKQTGTSTVGFQGQVACTAAAPCTCTPAAPCRPTTFHADVIGNDQGVVTYPQPIKNCRTCHLGGAQGDQRLTRPNRAACGACHDYVDFVTPASSGFDPCYLATTGQKNEVGCPHSGGPQANDLNCRGCHDASSIEQKHLTPISTPHNPDVPAGLYVFEYEITNVSVGLDARASIAFRVKNCVGPGCTPAPVTFDPYPAVTLAPLYSEGFSGGPTFYVAYSVPFMGIASPADFDAGNAASIATSPPSISLANIWDGTQGNLIGPDPSGLYTAVLGGGTANNVNALLPANAAMVTGVMIGSFTQINAEVNLGLDLNGDGVIAGGFNNLARAAYKVANGFTPRRQIVSDAKCSACHEQLGFEPDFHSGARNNGEICAICHNPIRNNKSWSGNMKDFVHGIHAGGPNVAYGVRTNRFGWHGELAFWETTYPSNLSNCQACHLPGTYDFSASQYTDDAGALLTQLLPSTASSSNVTAGTLAGYEAAPPWVAVGNYSDVGLNKSANLVVSPITAPCLGCHDSPGAVSHFRLNGGQVYVSRGSYVPGTEACLVCHGPDRAFAIHDVHSR
jgi:OmcA/MtrC family decaheme c-type cytochrome